MNEQASAKDLLIELIKQIPESKAEYLLELINTLSYLEHQEERQ